MTDEQKAIETLKAVVNAFKPENVNLKAYAEFWRLLEAENNANPEDPAPDVEEVK